MSYLFEISTWLNRLVAIYILFVSSATVAGFMLAIFKHAKGTNRASVGTQIIFFVVEGMFVWLIVEFAESAIVGFVDSYPLWALFVAIHITFYFVVLFEVAVRDKVKWTAPAIILLTSFVMVGLAEYLTPLPTR